MADTLGPIQLVVIGLENEKLKGQVAHELHRASKKGSIRILDALAIQRTKEGDVVSLGASDLTPEQRITYGAIVGGLLGLGAMGTEEGLQVGAEMGAEAFAEKNFGLSQADIRAIASDLAPGTTALMVLFEHLWAVPVKEAIMDAGGVLVAQGMVRPEALMEFGANIAAARALESSAEASQGGQLQ